MSFLRNKAEIALLGLGVPCLPYGRGNASMNKASRGCRYCKRQLKAGSFFAKDKIFFKKALSSMLNPHSNLLSRIYPGHRINRWSLRCYSQKEKPCRLKGNRSKDRGEAGATVSVMLGSQSRLSATFLLCKTWNRQVVSGDGRRWRALWGANGNKTSN